MWKINSPLIPYPVVFFTPKKYVFWFCLCCSVEVGVLGEREELTQLTILVSGCFCARNVTITNPYIKRLFFKWRQSKRPAIKFSLLIAECSIPEGISASADGRKLNIKTLDNRAPWLQPELSVVIWDQYSAEEEIVAPYGLTRSSMASWNRSRAYKSCSWSPNQMWILHGKV